MDDGTKVAVIIYVSVIGSFLLLMSPLWIWIGTKRRKK